jgi:DNA-binding CsgD family transcriptional regulator
VFASVSAGLTDSDVTVLFEAVGTLAEVVPVEELRRRIVAVVPTLVRTTLIAWNEVDLAEGTIDAIMEPFTWIVGAEEAFIAHVGEHPVITYTQATGDGRPHAISDFLSVEEFHATGLYQHFYRPLGAEDQMSFVLPDPDIIIGVALNRDRRDFSERDKRVLNLFRPQALQAYRNSVAYSRSQRILASFERVTEGDNDGLLLCDRRGRVEYATARASDVVDRWFRADSASPGSIPAELSQWMAARPPPAARSGPAWPLVLARNGSRLVVRCLPGPDGWGSVLLFTELASPRREALMRLGLTARQAEVLVLVAQGLTNGRVAERLGISARTVDKHVQLVFDKLGVENRTSAANVVRQMERPGGPVSGDGR